MFHVDTRRVGIFDVMTLLVVAVHDLFTSSYTFPVEECVDGVLFCERHVPALVWK